MVFQVRMQFFKLGIWAWPCRGSSTAWSLVHTDQGLRMVGLPRAMCLETWFWKLFTFHGSSPSYVFWTWDEYSLLTWLVPKLEELEKLGRPVFLSPHSLFMWLAWTSSQHGGLRVVEFLTQLRASTEWDRNWKVSCDLTLEVSGSQCEHILVI